MKKRYWLLLSLSALLLSGCVTTPEFHMTKEQKGVIPENWQGPIPQGEKTVPLSKWWESWSDPEISKLVAKAQASNTSIKVAQANLREALAGVTVSDANLLPWIDGSARAGRSHSNSRGSNSFNIGLNGSWTIDAGGRLAAARASEADALSSAATLADVQTAIAAQVASAYINLRLSQREVSVSEQNLKTQKEALDIAEWRFLSGLVDSTDVDQARTSLEQTRASLPLYKAAVQKYRNQIAKLTSQKPEEIGLTEIEDIPTAPDSLALAIPAETLRNRPDVRAAEAQVLAAMERHTQARSALFPSLSIGGSFGLAGTTIGMLGEAGTHNSSGLGTISLPIFNWGSLRAQVEQSDARVQRANANYEAALATAIQEIEDALNDIWAQQKRRDSLRIAVKSAKSAAANARQNYRAGLQDFTVVLTTQRSLLSVEESLASAEAQISNSYVSLYEALGGGWNSAEEQR